MGKISGFGRSAVWLLVLFGMLWTAIGNEAWDSGLKRYQLQLKRDIAFLDQNTVPFESYCDRLRNQFKAAGAEAELLYFMMLQRNRYDAFTVTLYSDKISSILHDATMARADFEALRYRLGEIKQVYDEMSRELATFDLSLLSAEQRELLAEDARENQKFMQKFALIEQSAGELELEIDATLQKLQQISQIGNQRQSDVIRTIFFDNESNFLKTVPQAGTLIGYWLNDSRDSMQMQFAHFSQIVWQFLGYIGGITLALCGIGYLIYRKLFLRLLREKMPELFQRRPQLARNFLILFLGIGLYWSERLIPELDMLAFRQLAIGLIMLACLRLALILRLTRQEQRIAFPVYYASIVTYFISMLLSIGMVSYRPLIVFSTILSLLAAGMTLALLRSFHRQQMSERIFGICTVINFTIAGVLGFLGFAYISLTMMLAWFVIVAQFQAILAVGGFVRQFIAVDARHPVFNQILSQFLLPAAWIWLLVYLVGWVAQTYHVEERIYALLDYDIVQQQNIAQFNMREVFLVVFAGIVLYFSLSCARLLLKGIWGASAEFGILPSFMILSNYVVWALYVIFVLVVFKVQYSSILVVVGGMSMGLGFGLKEIVENFIAGLILLIGQQVRPGDIVEVKSDGTIGKVLQVSVRATVVETFDGAIITYPNAQVLTKEFQNWTSNNMLRRRELTVGVAYGSDLTQVMRILQEAAQSTVGIAAKPGVEILCQEFGGSSIDFSLRYWSNVNSSTQIASNLRREIYRQFAQYQISIPFPQLDLHVIGTPPAAAEALGN